ncbi:hypothetical protein AO364_1164 [Moraxella catarrhalis]|nr:hypothetical protein AO364_1164 [Moraxella catarrhalis]
MLTKFWVNDKFSNFLFLTPLSISQIKLQPLNLRYHLAI